jgi:hypothetical protein
MLSPADVLSAILTNPTDINHVRFLATPDVTYASINYHNPDLNKIMSCAGTSHGPKGIVKTFVDVGRFWEIQSFKPEALFGSDTFTAMFGRLTYKSTVLEKVVATPFAVFSKVAKGRCSYLQFVEDTFATGASLRSSGSWTFRSDPHGGEVVI